MYIDIKHHHRTRINNEVIDYYKISFFCSSKFFFVTTFYLSSDIDHFSFKMIIFNRFSEIYSLIIILKVSDFTIFSGVFCPGVLRHQSKKREELAHVLFDLCGRKFLHLAVNYRKRNVRVPM